jgi:hypothetical protein
LARHLPSAAKLTLTGGGEAMLLGGNRPTGDLDFSLAMSDGDPVLSSEVEAAVAMASREAGVAVQYSTETWRTW